MKTKPVTVTLEYYPNAQPLGGEARPYKISKIQNEVMVPVAEKQKRGLPLTKPVGRHVGDFLTEWEANDLLTNPGTDVVTIQGKQR